jgi:hypothetical protein
MNLGGSNVFRPTGLFTGMCSIAQTRGKEWGYSLKIVRETLWRLLDFLFIRFFGGGSFVQSAKREKTIYIGSLIK